ncbi:hypothetical protein SHIRM173S_03588 [Streptomyces hirsutus]
MTPTGRPDWTSIVSSCLRVLRVRTMASKERQSRAALPVSSVDDELLGVLGDLGVEVVLQHAQGRLLGPAQGAQVRAARGADGAAGRRGGPGGGLVGGDGRAGS